jgi:hypothetical protein
MSKDHSKIIDELEQAVIGLDKDKFFYDFLKAYGIPSSTITSLKKNTNNRNIGFEHGDIGFKNKIYFRASAKGTNLQKELDSLKTLDAVVKGKARLLVVTDFEEMVAYDLTANELLAEIELSELHKQYAFFLPLAGYEKAVVYSDHPADVKASEKLGLLFDLILKQNDIEQDEEKRHALNVFLTRLLFCFYAEDTGIFKDGQMSSAISNTTEIDGSNLDQFFSTLFKVLNTKPGDEYRKSLPTHLADFPYVNGGLFASDSFIPKFGKKSRRVILESGSLDWKKINPDIFGSMFQSVVDPEKRGSLGQHYTSVPNIMKVIQPLFLDKLYDSLEKAKESVKKLEALIARLERIRVFDPACGSGNFLIIAYKELRRFEMEVFKALNAASGQSVMFMSGIKLSQFYGIEIDDFAHEIALLSLWLTEHQMNVEFKQEFGYAEPNLPLKDSGNVVSGNSLHFDWDNICPKRNGAGDLEVYICGNPPFAGHKEKTASQAEDMDVVFAGFSKYRYLDYVTCWLWKTAGYLDGSVEAAFVATNSICQGIQVEMLWPAVFRTGTVISFAYESFKWKNSARENAGVYVTVIGLGKKAKQPTIYKLIGDKVIGRVVSGITPYLTEGSQSVVAPRMSPLSKIPEMNTGNNGVNCDALIFDSSTKEHILSIDASNEQWIREILGGNEFLHSEKRYCLWLEGSKLEDLHSNKVIWDRVEQVRLNREKSRRKATRGLASAPHLFGEIRQPKTGEYIVFPQTSSERRDYVPLGIVSSDIIAAYTINIVPNSTLYEFSILSSTMHLDWMRIVGGKLETRYRYSPTLVYNTFPWPDVTKSQKEKVEAISKEIILIRQDYELDGLTLADMYDPAKMATELLDAHQSLDKAVEKLYRDKPFKDASERIEYLFARYKQLIQAEKNA